MSIRDLPEDVLALIFQKLPFTEIEQSFAKVSRAFYGASRSPLLWRVVYSTEIGAPSEADEAFCRTAFIRDCAFLLTINEILLVNVGV